MSERWNSKQTSLCNITVRAKPSEMDHSPNSSRIEEREFGIKKLALLDLLLPAKKAYIGLALSALCGAKCIPRIGTRSINLAGLVGIVDRAVEVSRSRDACEC